MDQDATPPPSAPCSVVVGFWGLSFSLSFCVWGLGFKVKSYEASNRQELREGLGCRLVRVTVYVLLEA